MKLSARQIAVTAALLAICIVSQFFKNTSVFLTGPVINACIILAGLYAGLSCGLILSVITPVTAFFISGSPVISHSRHYAGNHDRKCASRRLYLSFKPQDPHKSRGRSFHAGRIRGKISFHGNRNLPDSHSHAASRKNAAKNECLSDHLFHRAADHGSDRELLRPDYPDSAWPLYGQSLISHWKRRMSDACQRGGPLGTAPCPSCYIKCESPAPRKPQGKAPRAHSAAHNWKSRHPPPQIPPGQ